jgi:membrane protease YdiL (CAAX protease family)
LRLLLSLVVCFFCGSVLVAALHHAAAGARQDLHYYRLIASALGCSAVALVFVYRPWNNDNAVSRLGGFLVCFYGGFFLGALAQKNAQPIGPSVSQMIIAALSLQGAALMLVPHFLREQDLSWKEAFGFGNNWRRAMMLGVILACLFLPVAMGLQWLSAQVMVHLPRLQLRPQEQEAVQTLQMAVTWFHRLALGAVTIVLAPAAEEILFRGILYPTIKQAGFPRLAMWGTALLFAAIHLNLATFVPLTILALGLALLYERTDNLLAPITAHALFNAMNFVILYSTPGPANPN